WKFTGKFSISSPPSGGRPELGLRVLRWLKGSHHEPFALQAVRPATKLILFRQHNGGTGTLADGAERFVKGRLQRWAESRRIPRGRARPTLRPSGKSLRSKATLHSVAAWPAR